MEYYFSKQQQGIDKKIKRFVVERCKAFIVGPSVLDVGYVDDLWAKHILKEKYNLCIIEKNKKHARLARNKYKYKKNVKVICQDIEKIKIKQKFDTIILGDMIQYLKKPKSFLKQIKKNLNNKGSLIVTVPNAKSLHRRIGYYLSKDLDQLKLSSSDKKTGNVRYFDKYILNKLLVVSGWEPLAIHGCFLKPLSSKQMRKWSQKLLQAFFLLGDELQDYAWFLYAICKKRSI